jgi:chromosome segregation ATPase
MAYAELKEKLERLLSEDLSNRSTLQDVRRNLFLNSEGAKVQQQLLVDKEGEISSLNLLVEKKKTLLQLKEDEIKILSERVRELEAGLETAQSNWQEEQDAYLEKSASLEEQIASLSTTETKVSELSLQNEEFAVKIRELILHIDGQNTELENLKNELAAKTESATAQLPVLEEKDSEIARLQEKADLLFESESKLKMLVAAQNAEIESLGKQANGFKKQIEDIASGWQQQQEQLLADNSNLLAENALLREATASTLVSVISEEEFASLKTEKEELVATNSNLLSEIDSLKETIANTPASMISEEEFTDLKTEKEKLFTTNTTLLSEIATLKETIANTQASLFTASEEQLASITAEKEELAATNSTLLAQVEQLKEAASHAPQPSAVSIISEEQLTEIKAEKERLTFELEAIRHELTVTSQKREEKIVLLQSEISGLQNQLVTLSASLNQEAEEKNQISMQLEQLTSIVTEKEQQLNSLSNNTADEEFVDKLMQQINLLNDQKNNFETLYHDSVAELNLTRANLATLTQMIEGQKNSISNLEETGKQVKLAQSLVLQAADKTITKQAITELVREIDRCIALLSE